MEFRLNPRSAFSKQAASAMSVSLLHLGCRCVNLGWWPTKVPWESDKTLWEEIWAQRLSVDPECEMELREVTGHAEGHRTRWILCCLFHCQNSKIISRQAGLLSFFLLFSSSPLKKKKFWKLTAHHSSQWPCLLWLFLIWWEQGELDKGLSNNGGEEARFI